MKLLDYVESLYTNNMDVGRCRLKLYDYQKQELLAFQNNKRIKLDWSRQSGQTTVALAYILYLAEQQPINILVKSNKAKTSEQLISKLKTMNNNIKYSTNHIIELGNGSIITDSYTKKSKYDLIFLDEYDYYIPDNGLLNADRLIIVSKQDFLGFYESKVNWDRIPARDYDWATQVISDIGYKSFEKEFLIT
jgi:hypothetical protein